MSLAEQVPPQQVVDLGGWVAVAPAVRASFWRRHFLALSFLVCAVLPSLAGVVYFAAIASDRYVSSAGFAVRGLNAPPAIDGLGALTGLSAASTSAEGYIVLKYLESPAFLAELEQALPLRAIYGGAGADVLSRLDRDASTEDLARYWRRRMTASFDPSSGIVSFQIEAFHPEDAHRIAQVTLQSVGRLVNTLSANARAGAVRFSMDEVHDAETRLAAALEALRGFRSGSISSDPAASAQADVELSGAIEAQLIDLRARIAALAPRVAPDAPALAALRTRAAALEGQIAARNSASLLPDQLARYEALEVEKRFAEEAYAAALAGLLQARAEAGREQRYLAVFDPPVLPESAVLPARATSALAFAAAFFAVWAVAALSVAAVRDHLA